MAEACESCRGHAVDAESARDTVEERYESIEIIAFKYSSSLRIGIDVGSGKPPKFTDMMRLAADAEFRDAVTHMKAEMKNAGVNLDDPVRFFRHCPLYAH